MGTYDLSGRLRVGFSDDDGRAARLLEAQMEPFRPTAASSGPPDVALEPGLAGVAPLLDVQNPARDGIVTASDGERLLTVEDGLLCTVPDPLGDPPIRFVYEPGFPLGRIYARVVRPALQVGLLAHEAIAVHSAAVEVDGRAVLVAGWSETGKTETALALMEAGARFLSDKWTIVGTDGEASAFPINVGIRRWVLPYLPTLARRLPAKARAQLQVAGVAAAVSGPVRARAGRAAALAQRAVALADRAALTPGELRAAYGQHDDPARRVALEATVLLTTVPGPKIACEPVDPAWAAARLARSAAYERRELFAMLERRRYAFPQAQGGSLEEAVAAETRLLELALRRSRTFEVRAPFPVDPRAVAAEISRRL